MNMYEIDALVASADPVVIAAREHAQKCLDARGGWCVETLSHNIQSQTGLDSDVCDEIAAIALTSV